MGLDMSHSQIFPENDMEFIYLYTVNHNILLPLPLQMEVRNCDHASIFDAAPLTH